MIIGIQSTPVKCNPTVRNESGWQNEAGWRGSAWPKRRGLDFSDTGRPLIIKWEVGNGKWDSTRTRAKGASFDLVPPIYLECCDPHPRFCFTPTTLHPLLCYCCLGFPQRLSVQLIIEGVHGLRSFVYQEEPVFLLATSIPQSSLTVVHYWKRSSTKQQDVCIQAR